MRARVEYAYCGRCGKRGAHLREPWSSERRILEADGEFALRVIACRYCRAWSPRTLDSPWRVQAANWSPDPERAKVATRRAKRRVGIDEVVAHRLVKETGATVTVTRVGPGSTYEQEPGWMTLCLSHGLLVFHPTRALAMSHAAVPSGWCADCERIARGDAPRITTGKVL